MRRHTELRWHPKFTVIIRREACRHHADDRARLAIEPNLAPDDVAIAAEAPRPKSFAQNGDIRASGLLICWLQRPSEDRLHRKHIEQTRRRHRDAQPLRHIAFTQVAL